MGTVFSYFLNKNSDVKVKSDFKVSGQKNLSYYQDKNQNFTFEINFAGLQLPNKFHSRRAMHSQLTLRFPLGFFAAHYAKLLNTFHIVRIIGTQGDTPRSSRTMPLEQQPGSLFLNDGGARTAGRCSREEYDFIIQREREYWSLYWNERRMPPEQTLVPVRDGGYSRNERASTSVEQGTPVFPSCGRRDPFKSRRQRRTASPLASRQITRPRQRSNSQDSGSVVHSPGPRLVPARTCSIRSAEQGLIDAAPISFNKLSPARRRRTV